MTVMVSETYEIVTHESAEHGDAEERGWVCHGSEYDFRDLVSLLEGTEPSCYPPEVGCWFTAHEYDTDYTTGAVESRSYHSMSNRAARYMLKAWRVANEK